MSLAMVELSVRCELIIYMGLPGRAQIPDWSVPADELTSVSGINLYFGRSDWPLMTNRLYLNAC